MLNLDKAFRKYSHVVMEINKRSLKNVITRIKNENAKCGINSTLKPIFFNLYKALITQQQRNLTALRETLSTNVRQCFSIFRYLLCNTRINVLFVVNKPLWKMLWEPLWGLNIIKFLKYIISRISKENEQIQRKNTS